MTLFYFLPLRMVISRVKIGAVKGNVHFLTL